MFLTSSKRSPGHYCWISYTVPTTGATLTSHTHQAEIKVKEPAVLNDINASSEEVTCVYLLMTSLFVSPQEKVLVFILNIYFACAFLFFILKILSVYINSTQTHR